MTNSTRSEMTNVKLSTLLFLKTGKINALIVTLVFTRMRFFQTIIIAGVLIFGWGNVTAQFNPACAWPEDTTAWIEDYTGTLEMAEESIQDDHRKQILEIYQDRGKSIIKKMRERHFLFSDTIQTYLDNIKDHIVLHNPVPGSIDPEIYVYRSNVPNAACIGEGTIYFNIGLIRYLENESQVAFVMAHELAHLYLDHVNERIIKEVNYLNSKTTKKDVAEIKKSKYGSYTRFREWIKDNAYSSNRHTRTSESEADSLAIIMLSKSDYDLSSATAALKILDTVDVEKYSYEFNIKEQFDCEQYPFKDHWLQEEELLLGFGKSHSDLAIDKDSSKTHPDIDKRIVSAKRLIEQYSTGQGEKFIQGEEIFHEIIRQSEFEIVEAAYEFENYGIAFYYALAILKAYDNDSYLRGIIGTCLSKLYDARMEYKYNDYVPTPKPELDESLAQTLTFLNKLKKNDLKNLGYYFMERNYEKHMNNEHFVYGLYLVNKTKGVSGEAGNTCDYYNEHFPQGKFKEEINKKLIEN
ncbi:MAG: M48 family metalloprotease [Bacteroidetes bacterium]|nr:M48 family metalloprotease [Bacteroidota bacterium]